MSYLYTPTGGPYANSADASREMRAEFKLIAQSFCKLPKLDGNAGKLVVVNDAETAYDVATIIPFTTVTPEGLTVKLRGAGSVGVTPAIMYLSIKDVAGTVRLEPTRFRDIKSRQFTLTDRLGALITIVTTNTFVVIKKVSGASVGALLV